LEITMLKLWLTRIFALALLFTAGARAADSPNTPDAALKGTVDELFANLKAHHDEYKTDQAAFYAMVDKVVVPRFDVRGISQEVMGRAWRTASEDQRTRFTAAFKTMLVRSYATAMLDNFKSVKVTWKPVHMNNSSSDATVETVLGRDNGQQYVVGFAVHQVDNDWKIYDISIQNISLVLNFRSQLASEIKKTSLDDVIARMEKGQFSSAGVKPASGHS
jgi:phospholipid transport system substrate-binding protein